MSGKFVTFRLCKTYTILDYRFVLFLEGGPKYVELKSVDGRRGVARVEQGPCVGVSREVAYLLYPYYGWERMDVAARFEVVETTPKEAERVVMRVPFGINEMIVRRQLEGFPIYEGSIALEYMDHIEFGEVVHVEPAPFSILTEKTKLRLVEVPVEDTEVVYMRR
ncbi:MAG: hypothetical protein QXP98_03405 [Thermoproteus sp.]